MKRVFTLVAPLFVAVPLLVGCTHETTETTPPPADTGVVETETVEIEEPVEDPAP